MLNELCHAIFYIKINAKTNDPVLLFKTIFKLFAVICWYGWQGSLNDGHRLKLGKVGPTCLGLMLCRQKLPK